MEEFIKDCLKAFTKLDLVLYFTGKTVISGKKGDIDTYYIYEGKVIDANPSRVNDETYTHQVVLSFFEKQKVVKIEFANDCVVDCCGTVLDTVPFNIEKIEATINKAVKAARLV